MRYYCIKQHDITDCAAACLATIAKQYGDMLAMGIVDPTKVCRSALENAASVASMVPPPRASWPTSRRRIR